MSERHFVFICPECRGVVTITVASQATERTEEFVEMVREHCSEGYELDRMTMEDAGRLRHADTCRKGKSERELIKVEDIC